MNLELDAEDIPLVLDALERAKRTESGRKGHASNLANPGYGFPNGRPEYMPKVQEHHSRANRLKAIIGRVKNLEKQGVCQ